MKICIDPGHGGSDPGTYHRRFPALPKEKDIVLSVAKKLRCALELDGHIVLLTRLTDEYVELNTRCVISNAARADLFVSIHCNGADNPQANGQEIIHHVSSSRGKKLADLILRETTKAFPLIRDRGLKAAPSSGYPRSLTVLNRTQAPAALVELAFLTNDNEAITLADRINQIEWAKAIARGINRFT